MKIRKILLTGATGFVGSLLRKSFKRVGYEVVAVSRSGRECTVPISLHDVTDWQSVLTGVDCVVHAAARVHVMDEKETDPLSVYRSLNVVPTLRLAEQAALTGVRRFVFISSVKACAESSVYPGGALTEDAMLLPDDPYGISKFEAESGLLEIAKRTDLEVVIVRPPLVYGPGVKANFNALMKLIASGVPLPVAGIRNKRSLIGLQNLVSFVSVCVEHPLAANQIFFVSDGNDLSTPELVDLLGRILRGSARQFQVPELLLRWAGLLFGKASAVDRLCGSLQVDISKANRLLGWTPPFSVEEQLRLTAAEFSKQNPQHATYPDRTRV